MFQVLTVLFLGFFSVGAEDKKKTEELKRTARNPGLLHLAHAGHSVGSYVGPGGGEGGGGPHIVIVGTQQPRVFTRVASQDSLEELEADLKQHYSSLQQPGIRYVPNSSARGLLDQAGRQHLSFAAQKAGVGNDYRAARPTGHDSSYRHNNEEISYRTFPILFNQPLAHPGPFHQLQPILGHPQGGLAPISPTAQYQNQQSPANQSPRPTYQSQSSPTQNHQNNPTPATANYASPSPFTATLSPLSHTIASPGAVAQHGQPIFQALPVNQGFQGNFQAALGHQGPIFVPIQALGGHPQFQGQRFAFPHGRNLGFDYQQDYSNEGRSHSFDEVNRASAENERQHFFDDDQGRDFKNAYPTLQRGFETSAEGHQSKGFENTDFDQSFRYGSEEGRANTAAAPAYRNSNSLGGSQGSAEDNSLEISSGERSPAGNSGTFKYSFGDNHGITGRSSIGGGDANVATSYQSVTFETHSVPVHITKKA